jgi:hypothetical protein
VGGWAVAEVAEAVLHPSRMSGPRAYGCCVAVIVSVLRLDSYLQQTRDMEVVLGCLGTVRRNDSLVGEHAAQVVLPQGARARESQDDVTFSLRWGRCGRFLSVDSRNAIWEWEWELFVVSLLLWQQM